MDANDPRAARFKKAVESADASEIRRLFDAHPELEQVVDEPWFAFDTPALVYVVLTEKRAAIDVRVRFGKSREHVGHGDKYIWALDFAQTPAEVARRRGNDAVYDFLLERSSPFVRLLHASRRGDIELLSAMLRDDPELLPSLSDDQISEALSGTADAARMLLEHGANPNARGDENGATALHWGTPSGWANANGHDGLAELLR